MGERHDRQWFLTLSEESKLRVFEKVEFRIVYRGVPGENSRE